MFVRASKPIIGKQSSSVITRGFATTTQSQTDVVIVSAVRTPIGTFQGPFASLSAPDLGTIAAKEALDRAGNPTVDEAILGNVISANVGQAPTKQVVKGAGLGDNVPSTTINKVCASGMKSVMFGAQAIMTGQAEVVLAGGMESMSNVPHYLPSGRTGLGYGHGQIIDGVIKDGLWDVYNDFHMGMCAEKCAAEFNIGREEQDNFAISSYKRAAAAVEAGKFKKEIVPVSVAQRRGEPKVFDTDMEYTNVKFDKIPGLRPAFKKDGTVTAANASSLNDGAAALVLMTADKAASMGLEPLAKIRGFADYAHQPVDFTTAPAYGIPKALKNAGVEASDVDFYEINEAFAVVSLVNNQLLNLDPEKVNVYGGAVALGHPIGASGARILVTLTSVLEQESGTIGVAGICNGGGGASAIVIEKL